MRPLPAALAFLLVIQWLLAAAPARGQDLILSVSTQEVRITSNFTGTNITVFGAIVGADQGVSPTSVYDLVIVVRGPSETAVVRRKERLLGMWINRRSETIAAPGFLAVHSTRPLGEVAAADILRRLGLDAAGGAPGEAAAAQAGENAAGFGAALVRLKEAAGLYSTEVGTIDFPGGGIFAATVRVPASVPVGVYTASVLLFSSGALLAEAREGIIVSRAGLEQVLFEASREQPLLYAIAILGLAGLVGWLAGVIFRRD